MQVPVNTLLALAVLCAGAFSLIVSTFVRRAAHRQQKAEAALKTTEGRLRTFIDGAPVGIFESTVDGMLLMVNKTLATMLGYGPPEAAPLHRTALAKPLYVPPPRRERLGAVLSDKGVVHDYAG